MPVGGPGGHCLLAVPYVLASSLRRAVMPSSVQTRLPLHGSQGVAYVPRTRYLPWCLTHLLAGAPRLPTSLASLKQEPGLSIIYIIWSRLQGAPLWTDSLPAGFGSPVSQVAHPPMSCPLWSSDGPAHMVCRGEPGQLGRGRLTMGSFVPRCARLPHSARACVPRSHARRMPASPGCVCGRLQAGIQGSGTWDIGGTWFYGTSVGVGLSRFSPARVPRGCPGVGLP